MSIVKELIILQVELTCDGCHEAGVYKTVLTGTEVALAKVDMTQHRLRQMRALELPVDESHKVGGRWHLVKGKHFCPSCAKGAMAVA